MSLADNTCVPCRGGVPSLEPQKIQELLGQLESGWALNDQGHIERTYEFPNFANALAFTNRVGNVAEIEGHHPDLLTEWGKVTVTWWSHKIKGLHRNDFIMAAKTDALYA